MKKEDKPKIVQEMINLAKISNTIALMDMSKLPSRQVMKIKRALSSEIKIKMSRKSLILRALRESGLDGLDGLAAKISGSPALLFSRHDPFKLYSLIKKNRAKSNAKPGDRVDKNVVIPKGPTGIPPGPAISTLQKAGLKTRVEGGKIAVIDDKIVLKAGEQVTDEIAAVFSLLKIEPLEIGLNLTAAWSGGIVFDKEVLDVDVDAYIRDIELAAVSAINLSVNIGYPTKDNINLLIAKAIREIRSLGVEAGLYEPDIMPYIIEKAVRATRALEEKIGTIS